MDHRHGQSRRAATRLSRRNLLAVTTGIAAGVALPPARAVAQAAASAGIATRIGTSLGSTVGREVGRFAFGQVMTAIGLDLTGAGAMQAALNEIMNELHVLQEKVDRLQRTLEEGLGELRYAAALEPVLGLIARNDTIQRHTDVLLDIAPNASHSAEERARRLAEAERQKRLIFDDMTPDYLDGPTRWDNALRGLRGQLGLIQSWSRMVATKSGWSFGAADAAKIQEHWDFLDAQQALNVSYVVDYYMAHGLTTQARTTLAQWYRNRAAQLSMLRGTVTRQDEMPRAALDGGGTMLTKLRYLPANTLIDKGKRIMHYLTVSERVQQTVLVNAGAPAVEARRRLTIETGLPTKPPEYVGDGGDASWVGTWTQPDEWRLVGAQEFADIANTYNGFVLRGGPDRFHDALVSGGFRFQHDAPFRVWVADTRPWGSSHRHNAFLEADRWWYPAQELTDSAGLQFCRTLPAEETYWY